MARRKTRRRYGDWFTDSPIVENGRYTNAPDSGYEIGKRREALLKQYEAATRISKRDADTLPPWMRAIARKRRKARAAAKGSAKRSKGLKICQTRRNGKIKLKKGWRYGKSGCVRAKGA
jgi:hypothetical protein